MTSVNKYPTYNKIIPADTAKSKLKEFIVKFGLPTELEAMTLLEAGKLAVQDQLDKIVDNNPNMSHEDNMSLMTYALLIK